MSAPTVTRWWWVRHAPVTAHGGRLYGQTDVPANTEETEPYRGLDALLPRGAVWVASHLRRTHQTATAIFDAGHPVAELAIERDLAEQDFGDWQGLSWEEFDLGQHTHKFWVAPARHEPPGGESFVAVMARVRAVIERRTAEHAGRDIVAVAHGGSIRAALAHALGLDPEAALSFTIDNLSITRIDHIEGPGMGGAWRVVAVNRPPAG